MALSINELNATTEEAQLDSVAIDSAYDQSVFFAKLKSMGKFTRKEGGDYLDFPIHYKKQGTGESGNPRRQITLQNVETITGAKTYRAFYDAVCMLYWDEKVANAGRSRIVDLAADRIEVLRREMLDKLCTDLFSTATPGGTYDLQPLPYIIDNANTYAGIAVADAANWASTEDSSTTTLILFGSGSLSYMVNTTTLGTNHPTMHITSRNLYSKFMSIAEQYHLHYDEATAKLGFQNLVWIDAPVVGDGYCPAGYWLGIDLDAFEIYTSAGENGIEYTEWMDMTNQGYVNSAAKIGMFVGQVVCKRRKTNFKYSALDYTK